MSHTVTETAAFSASVTVPDPGDPIMASDLENAVQPLANRSQWTCRPGDHVLCVRPDFDPNEWQRIGARIDSLAGNAGGLINETVFWGLGFVPDGSSITKYGVLIQPAGGHGALPAQKARIRLMKRSFNTGTATAIDTETDPAASVVNYELQHTILKTLATPYVVDHAIEEYYLEFIHESGANSVAAGLQVHGARVSWS